MISIGNIFQQFYIKGRIIRDIGDDSCSEKIINKGSFVLVVYKHQ